MTSQTLSAGDITTLIKLIFAFNYRGWSLDRVQLTPTTRSPSICFAALCDPVILTFEPKNHTISRISQEFLIPNLKTLGSFVFFSYVADKHTHTHTHTNTDTDERFTPATVIGVSTDYYVLFYTAVLLTYGMHL